MSRPIIDEAEVSIDFPEKFYAGSFGRGSVFDATADAEGVHVHLERVGAERRRVGFHIHYFLLADLLDAVAEAIGGEGGIAAHHRAHLSEAAGKLAAAAGSPTPAPRARRRASRATKA